jgi:hypothetical protein
MIAIGFDFSCNKPACCVKKGDHVEFLVWPLELDEKSVEMLRTKKVYVFNRDRITAGTTSSEKFRVHVTMAGALADQVMGSLEVVLANDFKYKNNDIKIAFEGSSFGSKGDAGLQLAGYRYVLMEKLGKKYGLENIFTYAPLTIKSVAGCASKDKKGKDSMINALSEEKLDHLFIKALKNDSSALKKKTNYISTIDDLADSYWVLQTMLIKEKFI